MALPTLITLDDYTTEDQQIIRIVEALYGQAPGSTYLNTYEDIVDSSGLTGLADALVAAHPSAGDNAALAADIVANFGINSETTAEVEVQGAIDYVEGRLNAESAGAVVAQLANWMGNPLYTAAINPAFAVAAAEYKVDVLDSLAYSTSTAFANREPEIADVLPAFEIETITNEDGSTTMRITGDTDVRIDFTNPANQITGRDLNGDEQIAQDAVENNIQGEAAGFSFIDAYARNPLNISDNENNFIGDIYFDGTGFDGDGTGSDGNIFLGGLGSDTAFGGIGNDFMTGGQSGFDELNGGRNADFFFLELSELSNVNGDGLSIDGGNTADDTAAGTAESSQDSDWILLDASDDDEPVQIDLNNDANDDFVDSSNLSTRNGSVAEINEIEHISASGNLFGVLDGFGTSLGGSTSDHFTLGSTAQLNINDDDGSNNIIVAGYDNDFISSSAGDDIIFGGDMQFLTRNQNNPNILDITNDGMDVIDAGTGNDNILFEMDGGSITGGEGNDTLWISDFSGGTEDSAAAKTTDGVVRMDLQSAISDSAGYGGADVSDTTDQSNYVAGSAGLRNTVTSIENINATGLGAIDYNPYGTNNVAHQENYYGIDANLDLRGSAGNNNLYANTGDDVLEGRAGNDNLMGGDGNDDFIFDAGRSDGLDVIHRLVDADADNIWDGTYGQDFGVNSSTLVGASALTVDFQATDLSLAQVAVTQFIVSIGDVSFDGGTAAELSAANNAGELAAILNTAFSAQDADVTVTAVANAVVVTDAQGRVIDDALPNTIVAGTATNGALATLLSFDPAVSVVSQDRLIYTNYEDRADAELVDDDAMVGSDVTLGSNSYAEDKVISFSEDGTRIAESQSYDINLVNLAVEDVVTISVNGVDFTRQVGVAADGTLIAAETTGEFAERMATFINDFLDDDTAAGDLASAGTDNGNLGTVSIAESDYHGEETVFLFTPVVTIDSNESNGEPATATVTNTSDHEVHLLDFDGRDNNLNNANVIFRGDTGVNRAVLETAKSVGGALNGSDVIVVNASQDKAITSSALEGLNGAEISFNVTPNIATAVQANYVVHGDDLLIGGNGSDVISGGTGDDRIHGSFGNDTLDGGKDVYLEDGVLRVYNEFEALQADASPDVIDLELLDQDADGESGHFDDTLIYQQSDFGEVGANGSFFEITLNLDTDHVWGGAGKVVVDNDGANTSLFTNFENIRTVSGDGTLAGQGQDILDLSVTVNPITGVEGPNGADMEYFLTRDANAGKVRIDGDDLIVVDGVEHVLTGSGDDVLTIDETEAAKDNSFSGGLGDDTINYSFNLNGDNGFNPTMTLTVNGGGADVDYMDMTGGMLDAGDTPRDVLTSVENINLGDAAHNPAADDVLDVTNVFDSVVDFVNGQVRDGNGVVQVNVNLMSEFEIVNADFSDTVIVSDAMANTNASNTDVEVTFDSFLNYDLLNAAFARESIADMRANNELNNNIPEVENLGLFTFNMGPDTDTVDYSNETGLVAAVANFDNATSIEVSNVLVSNDNDTDFTDNSNRVDMLTGTENLVASQGESIIDLTSATSGLKVRFNADDGAVSSVVALDRDVFRVQLTELATATPVAGMNFLSYEDAGNNALVNQVSAEWNTVEGSDHAVMVELTDHETTEDHTFNLRGGNNEANYNELTRSIVSSINIVGDEIQVTNTFTDGNNLVIGGTDFVTSHTAQNTTAAGSLRIEASQDAEDSVTFAVGLEKVFLLGEVVNGSDQITVILGDAANANSMELTGYEVLIDAASDDVYDMDDLDRVLNNITLQDDNYPAGAAADHDTIKVGNDAVAFDGGPNEHEAPANSISLEVFNDTFAFDFDLLDVTSVTTGGLTLLGDDDDQDGDLTLNAAEGDYVGNADVDSDGDADSARNINTDTVILGDLSLIDDVQLFDVLAVTDASGSAFDFDVTAGELQTAGGATLFTIDADATTLDGSRLTADATLTVTGAGSIAVLGGTGDDTITGGTGNNTITGGAGADTLNGGVTPAVGATYTVTISGVTATSGANGDSLTIGGLTIDTATIPAAVTDIAVGADADQIGAVFAAQTLASWVVALGADGLTPAEANALTSVSYDATSNELSFVFDETATTLTGGGNLIALTTAPAVTGTAVLGAAEVETDFTPQVDTSDTFVYNAATESTEAAMDVISNFTIDSGAEDDIIDLSGIASITGTTYSGSNVAVADLAAILTAATAAFGVGAGGDEAYAGRTATDAYVIIDADQSGTYEAANDMVIMLSGITDVSGLSAGENFIF